MSDDVLSPASPEVVAQLVASHREFLAFLERRVSSRAQAEEILQAAFVRTLERGGAIRDSESAVAWFYRLLRNALIDSQRRRASEARALAARGHDDEADEPELRSIVCRCMHQLLSTLKPDYAHMLQSVDLDERPLGEVAAELQISPNNAGVRLHRARQALKQQLTRSCGTCATHGCLDCRCEASNSEGAAR